MQIALAAGGKRDGQRGSERERESVCICWLHGSPGLCIDMNECELEGSKTGFTSTCSFSRDKFVLIHFLSAHVGTGFIQAV